jgi:predicted RNase H-like HicB family nuclease
MGSPNYGFRVLWSEEDQAFIASCPEFEGVSGFGPTQEEALAEAKISLELAIETYQEEGWELPLPTFKRPYSGQFVTRTSSSQHALLALRARDEGTSMNSLVNSYMSFGLGQSQFAAELKAELLSDFKKEILSLLAPMLFARQIPATITPSSIVKSPASFGPIGVLMASSKGGN